MLTNYNGANITYDAIGNPLSDGTWTYTWEEGRKLTKMTRGSTTWTYTYDANGMRTKRTTGSATYNYTYCGDQLTHMTYGSNVLHFYYDASGKPLSVVYNGTTYYYVLNLQGDVVAILDSSGNQVVGYSYDAWGNPLTLTGSKASTLGLHNPLRYRGYVYDRETGLYYVSSRYYNPEIGRWINADALVSTGQGVLGCNMFAYCMNSPVSRLDKDGRVSHLAIGALVGAIAGFVGQVISDVVTSAMSGQVKISNWQTYTGAIIGGAAGGVVLAATGNVSAANAVTGAVTTGVGLTLEKLTIKDYDKSWAEVAANTVVDGVVGCGLGMLPGISGATAGRNNWSAVYKSALTKLRKGIVTNISTKVIMKGMGSGVVGGLALDMYYGGKQYSYDKIKIAVFN